MTEPRFGRKAGVCEAELVRRLRRTTPDSLPSALLRDECERDCEAHGRERVGGDGVVVGKTQTTLYTMGRRYRVDVVQPVLHGSRLLRQPTLLEIRTGCVS